VNTPTNRPRLALGPVQYYWPREDVLDFYERMAATPVDTVYLGETVCSKRRALRPAEWVEVGRALARAGKEVVMSSLTLVEAGSELGAVRRLCEQQEFLVEANDYSAVAFLTERGVPFVGGPALNLYSAESLAVLVRRGLMRWVPPVELPAEGLRRLLDDWQAGDYGPVPDTELFALGRMPLAWSARCFTACAHGRPKDDCGFVCMEYPDGCGLETQDGEPFLTLNGIQTQSGRPLNLLPQLDDIRALGVGGLRVSPVANRVPELLEECDRVLRGAAPARAVAAALDEPACDGYWHGAPGLRPGSV